MPAGRVPTHGLSKTVLFKRWIDIRRRCYDKSRSQYSNYGGRGIVMCDKWKNDFMSFHKWAITNGYKEELKIDRINNDGNYTPENCRFVTDSTNNNNKRNCIILTYNGKSQTRAQWATELNINYPALAYRLKNGWPIEKVLSTPVRGWSTT
jgi:hypothetical protein